MLNSTTVVKTDRCCEYDRPGPGTQPARQPASIARCQVLNWNSQYNSLIQPLYVNLPVKPMTLWHTHLS